MYSRILGFILCGLMVSSAHTSDIYKCVSKDGAASYRDTPCLGQRADLLHKDTDAEAAKAKQERVANAIDGMLQSGRLEEARSFAAANGVIPLFQQRVQANARREQEERQQEVANDAEVRREEEAAAQARHQQAMDEYHAKLVKADAEEETFRKEHWSEIKQQHLPEVLQSQSSKTYNAARGQWCSVGQDGSTVCQ